MLAARLLVDQEGEGEPASGEDAVGQAGEGESHRNALSSEDGAERLEYRMLEGACRTGEVLSYLGSLAEEAEREGKPVVVVLDNAPFHKAGAVRDARAGWEKKGLRLRYLPAYCPHLNPIEGVWRRLKGFLMPRRFYDSLAELKEAVVEALNLLGAVALQC